MTMLVDELRRYESGTWCHLVSDASVEELHAFARLLGLRRSGKTSIFLTTICGRPKGKKPSRWARCPCEAGSW